MRTFPRRLALGFALVFSLFVAIGAVAYRNFGDLVTTSYFVSHTHAVLENIQSLASMVTRAESGERGFVITGEDSFLGPFTEVEGKVSDVIRHLRELTSDNPNQQRRLDAIEPVISARLAELRRIIEVRRSDGFEAAHQGVLFGSGKRTMDEMRRVTSEMEAEERMLLKRRAEDAEASVRGARSTLGYGTLIGALLVVAIGYGLTRALDNQVGSAVLHIQNSSVELQAAANQQVTGSKQQASAMTEIRTTTTELLATSRQIAESAQHVSRIAAETARSAQGGDQTMQRSQDSSTATRRQVDLIVTHMLELGRKSQQIGGILEIINELAEQTNILSINATIEAAGAGDAGRRFAVVADEIRKLSDRVGGSTKEIRALVDEIRSAVNTTIMATESGSKAVDAVARQFVEAAEAFAKISSQVINAMEAAKEIELSTKQQASAVEQVNLAIANVSQAARETEASSSQTLQTSSQLTLLSKDLARLIQPQAAA
jgi:methyl-accepting chemotaxis protein